MINTNQITVNRKAIVSFIVALLALFGICTGILPIPFAFILCYPPGILFGIVAIVLGIRSQREIRGSGEDGRTLARVAIWLGGLSLFAYVCMITAGALLLPHITEYISQFLK